MEQPMKKCPRPICALPQPLVQQFVLNKVVQTALLIVFAVVWGIKNGWKREFDKTRGGGGL